MVQRSKTPETAAVTPLAAASTEIESSMPKPTDTPRAELHTHLGGAVDPPILWSIAHRQGIRLPTKDYWGFEAMVTMKPGSQNRDLDEMPPSRGEAPSRQEK